ncbi:MAG TPA: PAS domain S-box protein [Pyrinomonadaceae bacterium]|jgi:PAS domain S-box-containing protein|nr:PAS domain S-box protein [Pyrinomonadaceae bacterium]
MGTHDGGKSSDGGGEAARAGGGAAAGTALGRELGLRERQLASLFETTRAGLAVLDGSLRYVHVNDTLAGFSGRTPEEFIGKTVREVAPSAAVWVEPVMRRIFETGEPVLNLEVAGTVPDEQGRTRQWLISFVPAPGEGGSPSAVSVLVLDITDVRELERTLSESEARVAMLAEHTSDAVLVFDEGGRFLEVNPRLYRMLGYTREEMSGMRVEDLIPVEDLAADPIPHAELQEGKTVRRRRRLRRKDGSHVAVEVVGSMIGEGRMQSIVRELQSESPEAESRPAQGAAVGGRVIEQLVRSLHEEGPSGRLDLLKEISVALSAAVELLAESRRSTPAPEFDMGRGIDFYDEVSRFESNLIRRALEQTGGNQKRAADLLGIKKTTINAMIHRYRINPHDPQGSDSSDGDNEQYRER